jgi:microsomal dipeptidase-like Zn-dependent dipeptidase
MDYIYQTIQAIHTVTNSFDNIAIGTDFDAMNNPSDDMFNHSLIPKLVEYLSMKGISEKDIEKIMSANAIRILKEGWGK